MRLKGRNRVCFTSSERAVVRSPTPSQEDDMANGIDKDIEALMRLAQDQGWTVTPDGSRLKWTNPEPPEGSNGLAYTPTRVMGRGLNNIRTQLRKAGLVLSAKEAPEEPKSFPQALYAEQIVEMLKDPKADSALQSRLMIKVMEPLIEGLGLSSYEMGLALGLLADAVSLRRDPEVQTELMSNDSRVAEAEEAALKAMEESDSLRNALEREQKERARIDMACSELKLANAALTERANAAENKLRMFRDALKED